jgi:hypothetical protein
LRWLANYTYRMIYPQRSKFCSYHWGQWMTPDSLWKFSRRENLWIRELEKYWQLYTVVQKLLTQSATFGWYTFIYPCYAAMFICLTALNSWVCIYPSFGFPRDIYLQRSQCILSQHVHIYQIRALKVLHKSKIYLRRTWKSIKPLMPELNPSAQRCLTRCFTGHFASWTVNFVNTFR